MSLTEKGKPMDKKFSVLVDTIEYHTRRYIVEAEDEEEAEQLIYDGTVLEYADRYEGQYQNDDSFLIVEVQEVGQS